MAIKITDAGKPKLEKYIRDNRDELVPDMAGPLEFRWRVLDGVQCVQVLSADRLSFYVRLGDHHLAYLNGGV